eukprot:COSAG06_NODE_35663_length_457_cov_0.796089_1_plen_73_part_10
MKGGQQGKREKPPTSAGLVNEGTAIRAVGGGGGSRQAKRKRQQAHGQTHTRVARRGRMGGGALTIRPDIPRFI